jgi:type I restriction enzyme S subunit
MIHDLEPYPAMKDSGVPWLGEVPEHWRQLPGRACFTEKKTPNTGLRETTVLSLSYGQIVVKPPDKLHGLVPASFETYQIIEPGNIVIRPTDLQNDWNSLRFGLAKTRGIITSAYMCFRTNELLASEYGHLLLHTYDLQKVFYGLGSGLRQNLDWGDFKYLPCLVPPCPEQSAIVRFLDHADRRIRRYIRAKQKLIKLLDGQKQAIIHRAVTRGLDPNVRPKPSGVEWLGDVTEHWEVSRLKFEALRIVDCLHATPEYTDDGHYPAIRTADVEPGKLKLERAKRLSQEQYDLWTTRRAPQEGDILYTREGERYGIAALVPRGTELCISQRMIIFRIRPPQRSDYVMWQLNCPHVYAQAAADTIGAPSPRMHVETIRNFELLPPPPTEQAAVVSWISDHIEPLDITAARIHHEIALLREYRTRLIADVVTGKLDVRGAAGLTNEADEVEGLDDIDALAECDEGTDDLDAAPEEAAA